MFVSSCDLSDRSDLQILLERSVVHAKLDDLASQWIEFRYHELLQLFLEEVCEDLSALIVTLCTDR